jgi:hypothetical protein
LNYNPGTGRQRGCRLPKVHANSTNEATVQMAPQKVKFMAPASVMEDPGVQAQYIAELVKELAEEMGVDRSEINVQGLEETEPPDGWNDGRRMLSEGVIHVHLKFTLASDSPSKSAAALQSLNEKLADPDSTLGAAAGNAVSNSTCTACGAHQGQMMEWIAVCPGNMVREEGQNKCRNCQHDERPNDADNACEKCPLGENNPQRQRTCQCQDGRYDSSQGLIFCFEGSYYNDIMLTAEYETTRTEIRQELRCLLAPDCVRAMGGDPPTIFEGWSLSPTGRKTWVGTLDLNTSHKVIDNYDYGVGPAVLDNIGDQGHESHHNAALTRSLFRCPVEGEACFGPTVANESSDTTTSKVAACAVGHTGNLCGQCMHGYTAGYNELCSPCNADMEVATVTDWFPMIASILLAILLLVGLLKCTSKARGKTQRSLDRIRGRYAIVKSAYLQAAKLQGMEPPATDELEGCVVCSFMHVCWLLLPTALTC